MGQCLSRGQRRPLEAKKQMLIGEKEQHMLNGDLIDLCLCIFFFGVPLECVCTHP